MGMSISAKLIYGLEFSDVPEDLLEEVEEALDNGELDYASPYYDAPMEYWTVGVEVNIDGFPLHEIESVIANTLYPGDDFPECFKEMNRRGLLGAYVCPDVY